MILATIGQTITQAQAEYEARYARRKVTEEAAAQQQPAPVEAAPAPALPAAAAAPAANPPV